jgi:molybdopterin synthase sulfur carrier subunit
MRCKVKVPLPLLRYTRGQSELDVDATTVREAIRDAWRQFPELKQRLCDDSGEIRPVVSVYLNNDEVRTLADGDETRVSEGDEVYFLPLVTGG